jgi:hypothetical protein
MGTFTFMKGTLIAHNGANTMGANGNLEGRMLSTTGAIGFSTGVIYTNTLCFEDVVQIISAVDDSATIINSSSNSIGFANVLANDTLNGNSVLPSDVSTTFINSSNAGISLSGVDVIVSEETLAGNYTLTYQICQMSNLNNCSQAVVSLTVLCQPVAVPTITIQQPSVAENIAKITVNSPIGLGYTYSINDVDFQINAVFTNVASRQNYNVTVKKDNCFSTTVVTVHPQPSN